MSPKQFKKKQRAPSSNDPSELVPNLPSALISMGPGLARYGDLPEQEKRGAGDAGRAGRVLCPEVPRDKYQLCFVLKGGGQE